MNEAVAVPLIEPLCDCVGVAVLLREVVGVCECVPVASCVPVSEGVRS